MGILSREKNEIFETDDMLIVFDNDKKTSVIKRVNRIDADAIYTDGDSYKGYKVPLADCEVTTGEEGRNFFYRAPSRSIEETQNLADLEKSMVLRHVTAYEPPKLPSSIDWTKGILFFLIFVAIIFLGMAL